jgi:hypothetical protein
MIAVFFDSVGTVCEARNNDSHVRSGEKRDEGSKAVWIGGVADC